MTDAVITESPAGNGNTQAERTALSDQRMFEVAIELVNERGTAKTTLKDIGEGAGYSRGLASYRFGSKDGLWMELFARFDDIWKAHLSQYLTGKQGLAALEAAIQAQRDIFTRESGYLRAMYILWYESLGRESDIRASLAKPPCDLSTRCPAVDRTGQSSWRDQGGRRPGDISLPAIARPCSARSISGWWPRMQLTSRHFLNISPQR